MRTYDRVLGGETFKFRLTIGRQREMKQTFGEETIQTVLSAPYDLDKMSYLLAAAADYPGNENPTVNGDEIYDRLVDDGVCGQVGMLDVAALIAAASGIMDETLRSTVSEAAQRDWDRIVAGIAGASADPTTAPNPESETWQENQEPETVP